MPPYQCRSSVAEATQTPQYSSGKIYFWCRIICPIHSSPLPFPRSSLTSVAHGPIRTRSIKTDSKAMRIRTTQPNKIAVTRIEIVSSKWLFDCHPLRPFLYDLWWCIVLILIDPYFHTRSAAKHVLITSQLSYSALPAKSTRSVNNIPFTAFCVTRHAAGFFAVPRFVR